MSSRRQHRRAEKMRRHGDPAPHVTRSPVPPAGSTPRVVVRQADYVVRLGYSRSQAARALGISRSTLRRLLPYIETIEMPWGAKLIPVDELERLASERRQTACPRLEPATRGRKPTVPAGIAKRIQDERFAGKSLRQIADDLSTEGIPTAHGGERWWPSTVRGVLQRLNT